MRASGLTDLSIVNYKQEIVMKALRDENNALRAQNQQLLAEAASSAASASNSTGHALPQLSHTADLQQLHEKMDYIVSHLAPASGASQHASSAALLLCSFSKNPRIPESI